MPRRTAPPPCENVEGEEASLGSVGCMRPMLSRGLFAAIPMMVLAVSGPGCGSKKPTALVVAVSSEANVPKEIDGFEIEVRRGDSTPFFHAYGIGKDSPEARLPGTITLAARDGEGSQATTIVIRASLGGKTRVLRQATLSFSDQKTRLLKMPLRYSCLDFPDECAPGTSCHGGECAPDAVDVATLPEFSPELVFGTQGDATCFDDRLTSCLASLQEVDVTALAATPTCQVAVPPSAGPIAKLNVAFHWKRSNDPQKLTVLDVDPQEGWSYTANKDGFSLSRGLCAAVKSGAVTRVVYSTQCDSKQITQPICVVASGGGGMGMGAGGAGAGGAGAGGGDGGGSLVAACLATGSAYCDKAACDKSEWQSADACKKYVATLCPLIASFPGVSADGLAACAASLQKLTCDAFFVRSSLFCEVLSGTLPDNAPCVDGGQCASGNCIAGATAKACGVCGPRAQLGGACTSQLFSNPCHPGAFCGSNNTCIPQAADGDVCPPDVRCPGGTLFCASGGVCAVPHAKAGSACSLTCPSVDADLTCVASTCVPRKQVAIGMPCDTSKGDVCVGEKQQQSVCSGSPQGTCTALGALGGKCTTMLDDCAFPLSCQNGACAMPVITCPSGMGASGGSGGTSAAGKSACAQNGGPCWTGPCLAEAQACAKDAVCASCLDTGSLSPECTQNAKLIAFHQCGCQNQAKQPACGLCCSF